MSQEIEKLVSLREVLQAPQALRLLAAAYTSRTVKPTAEEYLAAFSGRIQNDARRGNKLWSFLGVKSSDNDGLVIAAPYSYVSLAILCSLATTDCKVTGIHEDKESCCIQGTIPSTQKHFDGRFELSIRSHAKGTWRLEITVNFAGQLYTWGAGKALIDKLFQLTKTQVAMLTTLGL